MSVELRRPRSHEARAVQWSGEALPPLGGREWAEMTEGFHLEATRANVIWVHEGGLGADLVIYVPSPLGEQVGEKYRPRQV